jgi:hypothetical protein
MLRKYDEWNIYGERKRGALERERDGCSLRECLSSGEVIEKVCLLRNENYFSNTR